MIWQLFFTSLVTLSILLCLNHGYDDKNKNIHIALGFNVMAIAAIIIAGIWS